MAALPKVKRKLKSAEYVNTQFGSRATNTNDKETQENYEEIDISAINFIEDNKGRITAQPNEYLNWDERKHKIQSAHNDQTKECVQIQNYSQSDLKLPGRKSERNTKWKITTLIFVILCFGFTSGLIAVLVVRLSAKVSPCSESICLNNGTCNVVADEAVCSCVRGFYGTRCERTPCSNSSCKNEGTCYIHDLQSRCACRNGFTGSNCEISLCSKEPCINGGTCSMIILNDLPQIKCTCLDGFHGIRCEVTPCSSYPCLNGGNCSIVGSDYNCTCPLPLSGRECQDLSSPRDCDEIKSTVSGEYTIYPDGMKPVSVYCIMANNEKWTVIQRRVNGLVDFYRNWAEYKAGFGSVNGEYWLGNDNIHLISTSSGHKLAIYMEDFDAVFKYANYSVFSLGDEHRKYQLTVSGFTASSGVGDSLTYHSGKPFSTKDNDNDGHNCPVRNHGAWWYAFCSFSNLNGPYLVGPGNNETTLEWYHWRGYYSLKKTTMMIKRLSLL